MSNRDKLRARVAVRPKATSGRRAALAIGGALAAGVAIAPGIRLFEVARAQTARPTGEPASPAIRWGMLVDATRCRSDCDRCVTACREENRFGNGSTAPTESQWIRKIEIKEARTGRQVSAPVMCQHCAEPPCVDVCPTGASFKRADGIVLVDRHTCIGCRYCMMACPYKARSFVHEPVHDQNPQVPRGKGCVESCTMCVHRIDRGRKPACVESCPNDAILFGDLNAPDSAIAKRIREVATLQIRADLGLDPGVRYHGL
ncbi:MAG: 4Fe-4S dicluster domain-containing protein [Burkholderiaceae bacterium]|nr:4Fe-4S dicluster domain-containing protein [Burkholderiaceae bacterium]